MSTYKSIVGQKSKKLHPIHQIQQNPLQLDLLEV